MTEFEKKYLEELKRQHDEEKEAYRQYVLALLLILGIGFLIALIIGVACISEI